ncbi:mitochondrial 54S ribosomal protein uL23m [Phyllosticta citriasiana]
MATATTTRIASRLLEPFAPFKVGQKQVFMPMFTVTLVRTPFLPPNYAKFLVPLHFNKLDMRDYLWHVYGIETVGSIRSFVQQQPLRMDKPGATLPRQRHWYRERSIKKMTVEMDKPFIWPEKPEDLSPWSHDLYHAAEEFRGDQESKEDDIHAKPADTKTLREQAEELLSGKTKWQPGGPFRVRAPAQSLDETQAGETPSKQRRS